MTMKHNRGTADQELTAAQQDYLEALSLLGAEGAGVRVTDLAAHLGTRLPTVTRTLQRLRERGLVHQEVRGLAYVTLAGRRLAGQLAERHRLVERLLGEVLHLPPEQAARDACVIEHGLSGAAAGRLAAFLGRWDQLPQATRRFLTGRRGRPSEERFDLLGDSRSFGGRH
ncbi:metal-dependent transcriptional regulator [bacterium]|nr:metal-dependent transcriptional regulator [bacterium]